MIVVGSWEIASTEGTTQGDPLAMAMHAVALIRKLMSNSPNVKQVWFADDTTSTGTCESLRQWWDQIEHLGPTSCYQPNSTKT